MVPQMKLQELRGDLEILKTNDIKPNYSALAKEYGVDVFHFYSTFTHYLQRKEIRRKIEMKVHLRYETEPGQLLQLDWKENLKTGEVIEYNLFVATFGYSRFHYYIYSKTKTTEDFLRCLIEVMQRAGDKPRQLITDNMIAVVTITNGYCHTIMSWAVKER